jgi:hypothetical protein
MRPAAKGAGVGVVRRQHAVAKPTQWGAAVVVLLTLVLVGLLAFALRPTADPRRTAAIVLAGQSNAANHASELFTATQSVSNFDYRDGQLYAPAADPLRGASGTEGGFAIPMADALIAEGYFDHVVLAPLNVTFLPIRKWRETHEHLVPQLLKGLTAQGLKPSLVLWQQGEYDARLDTTAEQYAAELRTIAALFGAPMLVAQTTHCGIKEGRAINRANVRSGRRLAVDASAGIFAGPDTDQLADAYRSDDCHFNGDGARAAARLWVDAIEAYLRAPN